MYRLKLDNPWHCSWYSFTHTDPDEVIEHENKEHAGTTSARVLGLYISSRSIQSQPIKAEIMNEARDFLDKNKEPRH